MIFLAFNKILEKLVLELWIIYTLLLEQTSSYNINSWSGIAIGWSVSLSISLSLSRLNRIGRKCVQELLNRNKRKISQNFDKNLRNFYLCARKFSKVMDTPLPPPPVPLLFPPPPYSISFPLSLIKVQQDNCMYWI